MQNADAPTPPIAPIEQIRLDVRVRAVPTSGRSIKLCYSGWRVEAGEKSMRAHVEITTGFPSAAKTAKRLGVSATVLKKLTSLAEHSRTTGEFVLPGVGRLVRVERKARMGRNPATGEAIKIPAKKVVKFRVAKAIRDSIVPPRKK